MKSKLNKIIISTVFIISLFSYIFYNSVYGASNPLENTGTAYQPGEAGDPNNHIFSKLQHEASKQSNQYFNADSVKMIQNAVTLDLPNASNSDDSTLWFGYTKIAGVCGTTNDHDGSPRKRINCIVDVTRHGNVIVTDRNETTRRST